ncbi:MAG: hypothetical protein ABIQ01_10960 [Pseudolysinimonas sp.]
MSPTLYRATLHRATLALGIAAVASCGFALTAGLGETFNLVHVGGASIAVLAAFGVLAIVAGARELPGLGLVAGVGFVACAVVQLVQLGQPLNLLGGDGSTMSLFGGLGIGLASVWLVGRTSTSKGNI